MKRKNALAFIYVICVVVLFFAFTSYNISKYNEFIDAQRTEWITRGYPVELFEQDSIAATVYATHIGIAGVTLTGVSIVVLIVFATLKTNKTTMPNTTTKNKAAATMLFLVLVTSILVMPTTLPTLIPSVKATEPRMHVNVLLYFDEECAARDGTSIERYLYTHIFGDSYYGATLYEWFLNEWNIELHCLNTDLDSYQYWSSPNEMTNGYELLQYAIQTHGGVWRTVTYLGITFDCWVYEPTPYYRDGAYYLADLLFFITGHADRYPSRGFSVPIWNALYIYDYSTGSVKEHEMCHQFWAQHCSNPLCLMNPEVGTLCNRLCGFCWDMVEAHREEFGNHEWVEIRTDYHGYTSPYQGKYQAVSNEIMTITAIPYTHYLFKQWVLQASQLVFYETTNPLSLTVTRSWVVTAEFEHNTDEPEGPSGGYGGGGLHSKK